MFEMTSGADWLIAGLGNPEPKYDGTRHNTGFAALDALAEAWGCEINKSKWQGLYGIAQVDGRKVMLLKPLTYMNLSGKAVSYWLKAEKLQQETLLVVVDDIAQPVGAIRTGLRDILSPAEEQEWIDELIGQAAAGFGEGLEQRPICTADGEIYLSFWNSGSDYFMENETVFRQRMSADPNHETMKLE